MTETQTMAISMAEADKNNIEIDENENENENDNDDDDDDDERSYAVPVKSEPKTTTKPKRKSSKQSKSSVDSNSNSNSNSNTVVSTSSGTETTNAVTTTTTTTTKTTSTTKSKKDKEKKKKSKKKSSSKSKDKENEKGKDNKNNGDNSSNRDSSDGSGSGSGSSNRDSTHGSGSGSGSGSSGDPVTGPEHDENDDQDEDQTESTALTISDEQPPPPPPPPEKAKTKSKAKMKTKSKSISKTRPSKLHRSSSLESQEEEEEEEVDTSLLGDIISSLTDASATDKDKDKDKDKGKKKKKKKKSKDKDKDGIPESSSSYHDETETEHDTETETDHALTTSFASPEKKRSSSSTSTNKSTSASASASKSKFKSTTNNNKGVKSPPRGTTESISEDSVLDMDDSDNLSPLRPLNEAYVPVNRNGRSLASSVNLAYFSRDGNDDHDYDHDESTSNTNTTTTTTNTTDDDDFLAMANDSTLDNWSVASSSAHHRTHSLSTNQHNSPVVKKKKSNLFANGTIKLKILPNGTTKLSKPKKSPKPNNNHNEYEYEHEYEHEHEHDQIDSSDDEEQQILAGSRSFSPTRAMSTSLLKAKSRRSRSADNLSGMDTNTNTNTNTNTDTGGKPAAQPRRGSIAGKPESRKVSLAGFRTLKRAGIAPAVKKDGKNGDDKIDKDSGNSGSGSGSGSNKKGRPAPIQLGVRRLPSKRQSQSVEDETANDKDIGSGSSSSSRKGRPAPIQLGVRRLPSKRQSQSAEDETANDKDIGSGSSSSRKGRPAPIQLGVRRLPSKRQSQLVENETANDKDIGSGSSSSRKGRPAPIQLGVRRLPSKRQSQLVENETAGVQRLRPKIRSKSADGLEHMQPSDTSPKKNLRFGRDSSFAGDVEDEDSEEPSETESDSTHSSSHSRKAPPVKPGVRRLPSNRRSVSADGLPKHSRNNDSFAESIQEVSDEDTEEELKDESSSASSSEKRPPVRHGAPRVIPSKRRSVSADGLVEMQRTGVNRKKGPRKSLNASFADDADNYHDSRSPKKGQPKRFSTRDSKGRSLSADELLELQRFANSEHSSGSKIRRNSGGNDSVRNRSSRVAPKRLASRNGKVRSVSADEVTEMMLSTSPRNSRKQMPPSRRNIQRNASAPIQPRSHSANRGQPRRTSMYAAPSTTMRKQPPRRSSTAAAPPPRNRRGSIELSTDEHVEMLKSIHGADSDPKQKPRRSKSDPGELMEGSLHEKPSSVSTRNQQRRRRSSVMGSKSLSPTRFNSSDSSFGGENSRSILRSSSNHSIRSSRSMDSSVNFSRNDLIYASDIDVDDEGISGEFDEEMVEFNDEDDDENQNNGDSRFSNRSYSNRNRQMSNRRSTRKGLRKNNSKDSFQKLSTSSFHSNRSQMSIDNDVSHEIFEDDPKWKAALRYVRLLPPWKNETGAERKIRIFTWIAMTLDFIAAMVSLVQYSGSALCCEEPIFNVLVEIKWDVLFRCVTVMYMVLIFAEFVPVVRNGIPFNLVNPAVGFIITFGMFFDDSVSEAVAMWVIEVLAIFFDFLVYRVNARMFFETSFELKQVEEELKALKKNRRAERDQSRISSNSNHSGRTDTDFGRRGSTIETKAPLYHEDLDDEESLSGHSFGDDEEFHDEKSLSGRGFEIVGKPKRPVSISSRTSGAGRHSRRYSRGSDMDAGSVHSFDVEDLARAHLRWERKQNKVLRQRRVLRERKKKEEIDLNYHFIGTALNVGIAVMAMIFIVAISSTGGLCFKDGSAKVFFFDQINKCDMACPDKNADNCIEYCDAESGATQCYFPYY